ncbi:DUF2867 domain-containing protein [Thalassobius sp. S69A]|uniref:DUF2867 domain-containing protein n=1 Tax=unclassified Thalassovita TaxID=2619711 RepID=UPI000C3558CC|nr:hypothetical protein [Paracoccaceae bacterium]
MTHVRKTRLPAHAHLWQHFQTGDFIDCYSCTSPLDVHTAAQVAMTMPRWSQTLLELRNRIVAPLGLKTELSDGQDHMFPLTFETEDELNFGLDDSHLNFRIAVMRAQGQIHMATWVHRNNLLGRAYLLAVMPFHVLLSRQAVGRIAQAAPAPA